MTRPTLALCRRLLHCCPRCGVPATGLLHCARCRLRTRTANAARVVRRGPNRIAHCGTWHQVDVLPWTCPTCHAHVGGTTEEPYA
jgi:hypothetical protein